jgi:hypothetical protein
MPRLHGKELLLTPDEPTSTYDGLITQLRRYNVRDGLRALGALFAKLDKNPDKSTLIAGVHIPTFALPPLALELILASDDHVVGQLDDASLASLVRCFHSLRWPDLNDDTVDEALIRAGLSQFSYQVNDPYRLHRTVRVFREIWPLVSEAAAVDIQSVAREVFGVELDEVLLFGYAFATQATRGFVTAYSGPPIDHSLMTTFTETAQARFLSALSTTYAEVRERASATEQPDVLRKFRFNPLAIRPFVVPEVPPEGSSSTIHLTPCPKFIVDRVTEGLVFDFHRTLGKSFDDAFGHVVERYVGTLLRDKFDPQSVRGDFSYRVGKKKDRAPDWMVLGSDRAVVIEVKRTILYSRARALGSLRQVRQDVERTLQQAVNQLLRFRRQVSCVKGFPERQNLELVVATWDETWLGHSVLMKQVIGVPVGVHVHVVSVRELERLLSLSNIPDDLYELLWSKRVAGAADAEMDTSDWLARLGISQWPPLLALDEIAERFFARWNLGVGPPV